MAGSQLQASYWLAKPESNKSANFWKALHQPEWNYVVN